MTTSRPPPERVQNGIQDPFPPKVTGDSGAFPPKVTGKQPRNPPKLPVYFPQSYRGCGTDRRLPLLSRLSPSCVYFSRSGRRFFEIRLKPAVLGAVGLPPKLPVIKSRTPQSYRMSCREILLLTPNHRDAHLISIYAHLSSKFGGRIPRRYREFSCSFPQSYRKAA